MPLTLPSHKSHSQPPRVVTSIACEDPLAPDTQSFAVWALLASLYLQQRVPLSVFPSEFVPSRGN